jgi:hypothetical protein
MLEQLDLVLEMEADLLGATVDVIEDPVEHDRSAVVRIEQVERGAVRVRSIEASQLAVCHCSPLGLQHLDHWMPKRYKILLTELLRFDMVRIASGLPGPSSRYDLWSRGDDLSEAA